MAFSNMIDKIMDSSGIGGVEACGKILEIAKKTTKIKDNAGAETEFTIGKNYFDNEDYNAAFGHFRKSIQMNSSYTRSYVYIARVYVQKNLLSEARKFLEKLLIYHQSYSLYTELANVYLKSGMGIKIVELWKGYIQKNPKSEKGYLNLGNYYSQNGQNAKAIEFFEKVLQIKKDSLSIKEEIADIYLQSDNVDLAEKILFDVFSKSENFGIRAEQGQKLIAIYLESGRAEKALEIASDIKGYTRSEEMMILLSDAYIANLKFEEAEKILEHIKKVNPINYEVFFRFAFMAAVKEDFEGLKTYLRLIVKFVDSKVILAYLKDFEALGLKEVKLKAAEFYSTRSKLSLESLSDLFIAYDKKMKDDEEDDKKAEQEKNTKSQDESQIPAEFLKVLEEMNNIFENKVNKQQAIIDRIGKMILLANQKNMKEVDKIIQFNNSSVKYLFSKGEYSSEEVQNEYRKVMANIKKGIDLTEKTNIGIYNRINDIKKKNVEVLSSLEKYLYNLNKLTRMLSADEEMTNIQLFIDSLLKDNE